MRTYLAILLFITPGLSMIPSVAGAEEFAGYDAIAPTDDAADQMFRRAHGTAVGPAWEAWRDQHFKNVNKSYSVLGDASTKGAHTKGRVTTYPATWTDDMRGSGNNREVEWNAKTGHGTMLLETGQTETTLITVSPAETFVKKYAHSGTITKSWSRREEYVVGPELPSADLPPHVMRVLTAGTPITLEADEVHTQPFREPETREASYRAIVQGSKLALRPSTYHALKAGLVKSGR